MKILIVTATLPCHAGQFPVPWQPCILSLAHMYVIAQIAELQYNSISGPAVSLLYILIHSRPLMRNHVIGTQTVVEIDSWHLSIMRIPGMMASAVITQMQEARCTVSLLRRNARQATRSRLSDQKSLPLGSRRPSQGKSREFSQAHPLR